MTSALEDYKRLEQQLVRTRWLNRGAESETEDALLDLMDAVWDRLTDAEREEIDALEVADVVVPNDSVTTYVDVDVLSTGERPPMELKVWTTSEAA